jgi:hypothetical protein
VQDIREVIDAMWDAVSEHREASEKVSRTWKEEAARQQGLLEKCGASGILKQVELLEVCRALLVCCRE